MEGTSVYKRRSSEMAPMTDRPCGSNDLADTCFENGLPSIKLSASEEYPDRLRIRARSLRRDSRERAVAHVPGGDNARRLASR